MPDPQDDKRPERKKRSDLTPKEKREGKESMVASSEKMERDEGKRREELQLNMLRSVVTEPLLSKVQLKPNDTYDVIISLNEFYEGGIGVATTLVKDLAKKWNVRYFNVSHYVFACLTGKRILELAEMTHNQVAKAQAAGKESRAAATIYRVWEDNDVHMSLTRSLSTVKADAAQRSFRAFGGGITWAVLDSGVQGDHPHFQRATSPGGPIDTFAVQQPLRHSDFTPLGIRAALEKLEPGKDPDPLRIGDEGESLDTSATALSDKLGHGTHVAGIIAGYWESDSPDGELVAGTEQRNELNEANPIRRRERVRVISGVAPLCRIVSMKVIADEDSNVEGWKQTAKQGKVSWILMAIEQIQQWNQHGRRLLVHGVNMSVGYDFDPRWFACGESPLCVEVNRLVKSGVQVVVSAGNGGYTAFLTRSAQAIDRYADLSITDPGNAEFAITVGSTHKEMPHRYGVSYFSSRGPTGDGRLKPDLLAPGERIISCAAGTEAAKFANAPAPGSDPLPRLLYAEQTGTSMAAPHVSGAIAAFLSVRTEFIGQPERVKEIFMSAAIDLRRERSFQGAGLLDLMKALQAV